MKPSTPTPINISFQRYNDSTTKVTWQPGGGGSVKGYKIKVNNVISDINISKYDYEVDIHTTPGSLYNIQIAAITERNGEDIYDWTDIITFRAPSLLPAIPIMNELVSSNDSVTLEWTKINGADGYEINSDGQIIDVGNITSYTFTGLESSSIYNFSIRSYNESGFSNWSDNKVTSTKVGIPGVPKNIICEPYASTNTVGSSIQITWDPIIGAASYEVMDNNGIVYVTNKNSIIIDNLTPGTTYDYRVRAVTPTGKGAYSSSISTIAIITAPTNITIKAENGKVRIDWNKSGGASSYEVELSGVIVGKTNTNYIEFSYSDFYMKRVIRIRGCNGTEKSDWSNEVVFNQALPVLINTVVGEELIVDLPVKNVEKVDTYKLTLTYNPEELELVDACVLTPEAEVTSTYIDKTNTIVEIQPSGNLVKITYTVKGRADYSWTGIASSVKFKSKISGTATLIYGVSSNNETTEFASISYKSHVQDIGWQEFVSDGSISGTEGQSKRIEAVVIDLRNNTISGGVSYSTYVQDMGWLNLVTDNTISGTEGQSKRIEAFKINLTGEMSSQFDIYYRVPVQEFGWMGWAKNGEIAGTIGFGYRIEAYQIVLVKKGGNAPGTTDGAYIQK